MTTARLMAQLDGARFVRYDSGADLLYAWHGGHGVHVYNADGAEVDYFSVGDFAQNDANVQDVEEGIVSHMADDEG